MDKSPREKMLIEVIVEHRIGSSDARHSRAQIPRPLESAEVGRASESDFLSHSDSCSDSSHRCSLGSLRPGQVLFAAHPPRHLRGRQLLNGWLDSRRISVVLMRVRGGLQE